MNSIQRITYCRTHIIWLQMSSGLFRKIVDYQAGKTMALRGGMQILRSTNCINQGQLQYFGLQIISKMTSKMGGVGIWLWQIRYLIKRIQNLFEVTCEYSMQWCASYQYFYWELVVKQTSSWLNHTSYRKVYPNEFVQTFLCCNVGMIIFNLHGYEGFERPTTLL